MTPLRRIALVAAVALAACRGDTPRQDRGPAIGPIRHATLPADQIERITRLHETFREVDPSPLEKWIEDFQRDQHPERELAIYEAMARAYTAFCRGRDVTLAAKREAYGVVLLRSGASEEQVRREVHPVALSIDDISTILAAYDLPPAPITVAPAAK